MSGPISQSAANKRFRIAKYGGDDAHSWALFENGSPRYTGMSRSEATWRRDTARRAATEGRSPW